MNWEPLRIPSGLASYDKFSAVGWIAWKSLQVSASPHPRSSIAPSWAQGPSGRQHGLLICLVARASQSLTWVDGARTLTLRWGLIRSLANSPRGGVCFLPKLQDPYL